MTLLVGTHDGLYRAESIPFEDAERVLDCGWTPTLRAFDGYEGVFAATNDGLFRSTDDGRNWEDLGVPTRRTWDVLAAGDRLYVGTQPARLYSSTDAGATWREHDALRRQPTVDLWRCAYGPDARVRTVAAHPRATDRLFVGIEAGGLYRSDDAGETWLQCTVVDGYDALQTDIHQVVPVSPDEYLVVCGRLSIHDPNHAAAVGGVYRTSDAGQSWTRVDHDLVPSYFKTILLEGETLFACGATTVPPEWPTLSAHATTFVSTDVGRTFEQEPYPGGPDEIVLAWCTDGDRVVGGTAAGDRGRVIARERTGAWRTVGFVPDDVHAVHRC